VGWQEDVNRATWTFFFFSTSKFLDTKQYISGSGSSAWFRNSFCGISHRALRVQVQRQWKPHCSQVGPAVVGRIISVSYKSRVSPGSIYLSIYPILSYLILSYPIYLSKPWKTRKHWWNEWHPGRGHQVPQVPLPVLSPCWSMSVTSRKIGDHKGMAFWNTGEPTMIYHYGIK